MTVKEILQIIPRGTVVNVYQTPIAVFDRSIARVLRQTGEIGVLEDSKQNYLEYEAVKLEQMAGIMSITCTASAAQEREVLLALYSGR